MVKETSTVLLSWKDGGTDYCLALPIPVTLTSQIKSKSKRVRDPGLSIFVSSFENLGTFYGEKKAKKEMHKVDEQRLG